MLAVQLLDFGLNDFLRKFNAECGFWSFESRETGWVPDWEAGGEEHTPCVSREIGEYGNHTSVQALVWKPPASYLSGLFYQGVTTLV